MLRLLPDLDADGPTQMAADEALLAHDGPPTLRLYRWDPPTVSLGYFQDYATIATQLPTAMPVVRRITGGGAIWHEYEITYCLVWTVGSAHLPRLVKECYGPLHAAIQARLRAGSFTLQTQTIGDRRYHQEPRCFASPAADDLIAYNGGKVLGSAGRQRGQRILMHGSLKLASNPWDGDTVSGCGLSAEDAATVLREGIAAAWGLSLHPGDWTQAELTHRDAILKERYHDDAWVKHRRGPRP